MTESTLPALLALGIDIGSTSTKAALVEVTDEVRVRHVARRPTPAEVDELLSAVADAARECARHADAPVRAVGIASMAESGAALDGDGRPLTPLLRWDRHVDRRHLDRLLDRHPELSGRTGVPATTKPGAVALTALRAERPDVFRALRHWAGVADLVAHALTGVRAIDHTLAARTMLAEGDAWNERVIDGLGLAPSVLPAIRRAGERAGVTDAGAAAFGLPPGVPVHVAGHDHAVGAWAAGARRPGEVADSLGTAEAIVRVTEGVDRATAVAAGFAVSRTVDGSALTVLGGSRSCGALLTAWERQHPGSQAVLRRADARHWPASPVTVLPYPSGRQCPAPDPAARLRVLDRGDDEATARGLLQSLVLQARWMREAIDAVAGSPASSLTLLGSLVDLVPAWAPLVATAGVPTLRCTAAEPVAAGAALLAAVREHVASPDIVLPASPVTPASSPGLDEAFRRFLDAVGAGVPASVPIEGES